MGCQGEEVLRRQEALPELGLEPLVFPGGGSCVTQASGQGGSWTLVAACCCLSLPAIDCDCDCDRNSAVNW